MPRGESNVLFKSPPSWFLRFFYAWLVALVLFCVDLKTSWLSLPHRYAAQAVVPFQYFVYLASSAWDNVSDFWLRREKMEREYTSLKVTMILKQAELQKLKALEQENRHLRELFDAAPERADSFEMAVLLASLEHGRRREWVINRGMQHGVFLGQAVLGASGVVGQISRVLDRTAHVMLASDPRSAIPVQNARTRERFIVLGSGANQHLMLRDVAHTADLHEGDPIVTSGLGGYFPFGYPVGHVQKIESRAGESFKTVWIRPDGLFERQRLLLLVSCPESQKLSEALEASLRLESKP